MSEHARVTTHTSKRQTNVTVGRPSDQGNGRHQLFLLDFVFFSFVIVINCSPPLSGPDIIPIG